jgi:hypothetical protein
MEALEDRIAALEIVLCNVIPNPSLPPEACAAVTATLLKLRMELGVEKEVAR